MLCSRLELLQPTSVQIFVFMVFAALVGCGDTEVALAPAEGFVTDGGDPVVGAIVEFFPENGRTSVGQTGEGGQFVMNYGDYEGVVIGKCKVQITPGLAMPDVEEGTDVVAPPMEGPPEIVVVPELVTVKDGEDNIYVFELEDYKKDSKRK